MFGKDCSSLNENKNSQRDTNYRMRSSKDRPAKYRRSHVRTRRRSNFSSVTFATTTTTTTDARRVYEVIRATVLCSSTDKSRKINIVFIGAKVISCGGYRKNANANAIDVVIVYSCADRDVRTMKRREKPLWWL